MKRFTDIDWSKHEIIETKSEGYLKHSIKMPNSYTNSVILINTSGIMAVTGDFGNWIFCREFHPSADGEVSSGYWIGKLGISSCQEPKKYCAESTEDALKERLAELNEEWEPGKRRDEYKEYLEECLVRVNDELDYTYYAYREMPNFLDYESVVFQKKIDYWLKAVFDAFTEICERMKPKEQELERSVATEDAK